MIYFLTNTLFFGSKVAEIVESDSEGFFLVSKDLPEGVNPKKHLPKPFVEMCPLIFSVTETGKTQLYKKGKWEIVHNGMYALLEVYFRTLGTSKSNQRIDSLSNLSSVCNSENINLKRCLSRNLRALVLAEPKNRTQEMRSNFDTEWVKDSRAYSVLSKTLNASYVYLMDDSRFPTGYRETQDNMEGKGAFGERCNVNACQTPGQAFFWNLGTSEYYCIHCAYDIRKSNLEDADLFPELEGFRLGSPHFPKENLKLPGTDRGEIVWK